MYKKLFLFFLILLVPIAGYTAPHKKKAKYHLSIGALFYNEAPYLKEWIEYHRMLGVDHFYLYNHMSEDNYLEVLQPYINSGVVELKDWNYPIADEDWYKWKAIQVNCYNDCLSAAKKKTKWLALIDVDEFIFPVEDFTIPELLEKYNQYAGVVFNWQLYGSSNIFKIADNRLMIELLTKKAETYFTDNYQYKTILKPAHVVEAKSAHYFIFKKGYKAVNTDYIPLEEIKDSDHRLTTLLIDKLRLNHYWTRDLFNFHEVKLAKQKRMGKDIQHALWKSVQLNKVEDTCMDKYIEPLRHRMGLSD